MTQEQMDFATKILDVLKWPLLIIVTLLLFRKSLINLISRIKGFKGGGYGFEADSSAKQQESDSPLKSDESKIETIENMLMLFSPDTRGHFQELMVSETQLDKRKDDKDKLETLTKYSQALYLLLNFERIYNSIFGSQIKLLNHLNSSFNETPSSIKFFYDIAVKSNPELSKYQYESYLEFLESRHLIELKDDSVQISWLGRDFLKFMVHMGLTDLKPN